MLQKADHVKRALHQPSHQLMKASIDPVSLFKSAANQHLFVRSHNS
jgi:hypothetical protein